MDMPLEAVRDRKTGDFYVDVVPSKNEPVTTSNVKIEAAAQQVMLNFGVNYGYVESCRRLEENVPSANHRNTERSKRLGELAIATATLEILEDIRSLSKDVYKLSSTKDMLSQFEQQNLF
ncbi:hypothetical protein EJD97_014250 [Solanum chilense]|uniref:Uncharacterized protein n=1 Tax=Solanum chilense TaxID=4083 RepID=A0A6N2AEI0_SOLCI|nr:hypothetical protein EJD97_014250 [Solanum chilense]